MKKLAFISTFYDTDVTVIKHLAKVYKVYLYIIIRQPSYYSIEYFQNYANSEKIDLYIREFNGRYRSPRYFKLILDMFKNINKNKCDLIYNCNSHIYYSLSYLFFTRKINLIMGIHDVISHSDFERNFFIRMSKKLSMHLPMCFITFSDNQFKLFKEKYKYECFNVGMSFKNFGKPTISQPSKETTRILFFGSLLKYKGYEELIKTFNKLLKNGLNNVVLTIAGNPKDNAEEFIKNNVKSNSYNIRLEAIQNNEIPNLFISNHFVVFPYRDATQSGPLMISLCYGIPIIAPFYGCFKDTYSTTSAIFYDKGNVQGLADSINKAVSLNQEEYKKMRCEVCKVRANYSEEVIARRYISIFDKYIR